MERGTGFPFHTPCATRLLRRAWDYVIVEGEAVAWVRAEAMERDATMTDKARFESLKTAAVRRNERAYGAEARERFGDDAVDAANARLLSMDEEAWNDLGLLESAIIE